MLWEAKLDRIREGDTAIEVAESGIPREMCGAPYYEQMQFVAALVAGYNRNYRTLKLLRKTVKHEMEENKNVPL